MTRSLLLLTFLLPLIGSILGSHPVSAETCTEIPEIKEVAASLDKRNIENKRFGLSFQIPANYRTSAYESRDSLQISVLNPSAFAAMKCCTQENRCTLGPLKHLVN